MKASASRTKRPTVVLLADDEIEPANVDQAPESFEDVEAFLADHSQAVGGSEEVFSEVAEALAVSCKERRSEINRLNKSRQFSSTDSSRRSFRIEAEELNKRTRRRRCGKIGDRAPVGFRHVEVPSHEVFSPAVR